MQHPAHQKIIFIISVLFFFTSFADAQNNIFLNETYLGISGGSTASMVYFKPQVAQDYITAYQGGLIFRYISEKSLGLQTEIIYTQRGWSETDNSYVKRLDYLEVPFLTHVYFGDKARFFFNIGPKIGYLLKETVIQNSNTGTSKKQHQAIQNKFDYGLALGLGGMVKIKKQTLQLEARGNFSASNLFPNDNKDYFDNSNLIYASVTLGWLIEVSK